LFYPSNSIKALNDLILSHIIINILLGCITVPRMWMWPIVTDRVEWSVCRSVCLSVCHSREPCKNRWTDQDVVWVVDSGGLKEPCIRWGADPPCKRAILRGKEAAHTKVEGPSPVSCAKTAEPIEMPFGMWTRVGPRKHALEWGCTLAQPSKSDWTVHVRWQCSLLSNYFDHLLLQ